VHSAGKKSLLGLAAPPKRPMFWVTSGQEFRMKTKTTKAVEQPKPFTPGITKGMVRQHAYELFRDKLPDHPLTLKDWVMAEKDLVNTLEAEEATT
jgi:hypothetical protein